MERAMERFFLRGPGVKFTAAQRDARNEGCEQGKRPYPVVWACQHCCEKRDDPDEPGTKMIIDNIGDDEPVVLEDDDEVGLTFAYHVHCCEVSLAELEFMQHRENGGFIS